MEPSSSWSLSHKQNVNNVNNANLFRQSRFLSQNCVPAGDRSEPGYSDNWDEVPNCSSLLLLPLHMFESFRVLGFSVPIYLSIPDELTGIAKVPAKSRSGKGDDELEIVGVTRKQLNS